MAKVYTSSVIPAPASDVWAHIRDFNGLPKWHPFIQESHIENSKTADTVGCVRNFKSVEGDEFREQLVSMSDHEMYHSYIFLSTPMPLTNYLATLQLTSITDGNQTFAQWRAEFDCAPESQDELVTLIGNGVFQGGFDALKQHFA